MSDEHDLDLHWHALNYRTASSEHAQHFWKDLQACVDRLVAAERAACAMVCEEKALQWDEKSPLDGTVSHWLRGAASGIKERSK